MLLPVFGRSVSRIDPAGSPEVLRYEPGKTSYITQELDALVSEGYFSFLTITNSLRRRSRKVELHLE
jgi:hypothetical protein